MMPCKYSQVLWISGTVHLPSNMKLKVNKASFTILPWQKWQTWVLFLFMVTLLVNAPTSMLLLPLLRRSMVKLPSSLLGNHQTSVHNTCIKEKRQQDVFIKHYVTDKVTAVTGQGHKVVIWKCFIQGLCRAIMNLYLVQIKYNVFSKGWQADKQIWT